MEFSGSSHFWLILPIGYLSLRAFGIFGGPEKFYSNEVVASVHVDEFQGSNGSLESEEEKEIIKNARNVTFAPTSKPHSNINGKQIGRVVWEIVEGDGSQWENTFDREMNPNSSDLPYRRHHLYKSGTTKVKELVKKLKNYKTSDLKEEALNSALAGALHYSQIQSTQEDMTFWPGDYGGPMFLLPGLVIACYVTGVEIGVTRKKAMLKYLQNHQQGDGGWGIHIESKSTMFSTVLNYVAMRLLGAGMTSKVVSKARIFIHVHGGATHIPPWGKFWLAILGVYDYRGISSVPPELFLLPRWLLFHPGRLWCQCRMVYLPMSAMYGMKYCYSLAEQDPIILALRSEIFVERYQDVNWARERESIAPIDVYYPQSTIMTFAHSLLERTLENKTFRRVFSFPLTWIRRKAIHFMLDYCAAEDIHTNYVNIGPVNKAMNMICAFIRDGPDSPSFQNHIPRLHDYLWFAEDGMKMQGYNGSQHWDTSFGVIAFTEVIQRVRSHAKARDDASIRGVEILKNSLISTYAFIHENQMKENPINRQKWHRGITKGGWGFSTADNAWPVSDCTSEGLKAVFAIHDLAILPGPKPTYTMSEQRIAEGIDVIMSMYNKDNNEGERGWASYEVNRGYKWFEKLNPAQVFGDIMIDYCYVECTSACIQAVIQFGKAFPENPRNFHTFAAAVNGVDFILRQQREDGSWYGCWGVCFTYGHWFGCTALSNFISNIDKFKKFAKNDEARIDRFQAQAVDALVRAFELISAHQLEDGGWGESVEACSHKVYTPHEDGSQVVQTAWALLGTLKVAEVIELSTKQQERMEASCNSAAKYIIQNQEESGDWAQEGITGVFNQSTGITYTAYRNVFPIWALAQFCRK